MATQNPIEQEGTYPLPEAQVDRFMLKVVISYPSKEEEKQIIQQNIFEPVVGDKGVISTEAILEARKVVRDVYIDEKIGKYIVDIVFATRFPPDQFGMTGLKEMIGFGGHRRAHQSTWLLHLVPLRLSRGAATLYPKIYVQCVTMCFAIV